MLIEVGNCRWGRESSHPLSTVHALGGLTPTAQILSLGSLFFWQYNWPRHLYYIPSHLLALVMSCLQLQVSTHTDYFLDVLDMWAGQGGK